MIFCVEDDRNIRELVVYTLSSTGMEAEGFEDGEVFFKALAERLPELILLDIMLPGEDKRHSGYHGDGKGDRVRQSVRA